MANLLYRASSTVAVPLATTVKGSPLFNVEIDANFRSLELAKLEASDAVSENTANTVVRRDASGNFTAGVITATDFNTTSDRALKDNIEPITNALDVINKIQGVSFNWKESGNKSYGVIAQDLEKVLPELVSEVDGVKVVSYIPLLAFLIEIVKDQQAQLDFIKSSL